jgi:hypothetical protein
MKDLTSCLDSGVYHDQWIQEYGGVYELPTLFGNKAVQIADPKAIAAFWTKDTVVYNQLSANRVFVTEFVSFISFTVARG